MGYGKAAGKGGPVVKKIIFVLLLPLTLALSLRCEGKMLLKNYDKDIFPVPVVETRPDEGQTYGVMPVLLFSDKETKAIKAIFGAIGQYNSVKKWGGAGYAYFYPHPDQEIQFFGEFAQRYSRELTLRYFNPSFFDKYYLEGNFSYLKTPFGRFYGLGQQRSEGDESNFVAQNFLLDLTGGFYFFKKFRANLTEKFHTTDLQDHAMKSIPDTLTRYGALPEVVDSTNFIHKASLVFDTRAEREYSQKGAMASLAYSFSSKKLGSDKTFQGITFESIYLLPTIPKRMTTAARFDFQQMFGSHIPFYEMSSLGGDKEMRAFVPGRFVDKGKIALQIEERIKVAGWALLGIPFEVHVDPFFEVGQVFQNPSKLGNHWKPLGGTGVRLFVPPNVVGRIDVAYGSDGLEIYTQLGYPF